MEPNSVYVAKAFLGLIRAGQHPTAMQVIDYVYTTYKPPTGWIGFDRRKWEGYVPRVVEALKSSDPLAAVRRVYSR